MATCKEKLFAFIDSTSGSSDAEKVVATDADGLIDPSFLTERVEDIVGDLVTDTDTIAWTYTDASGTLEADVRADSIDDTHIDWGTGANQVSAADLPVDNSAFEVLTETEQQALNEEIDQALLRARNTGVQYGGIITASTGTTVDITAGMGGILDLTTPSDPSFAAVSWSASTGFSLAASGVNYIYVDSSGTIQQQTTEPTETEYRTKIILGRAIVSGGAVIGVANMSVPIQNLAPSIHDLSQALGAIRVSGSVLSASGANLKLKISSGKFFDFGITRWTAPNSANTPEPPTFDTGVADTFIYATTSGVTNATATDIDVGNYQSGGSVTAIPGTQIGIHFVLGFPSGNNAVYYGGGHYTSFTSAEEALAMIDPYDYTSASVTREGSFVLGAVLAKANATDLSDPTQAVFVTTNKFGLFGGAIAVAGGAYLTLTDAPGSDTQVIFNNSGSFSASSDFIWDHSNDILKLLKTSSSGSLWLSGDGMQLFHSSGDDVNHTYDGSTYAVLTSAGSGFTFNGATVWRSDNDGSGSGLDADTVDSYEATALLNRTNHTGTQTLSTISDAGTAAAEDTGTSGNTIPFLDGNNTHSGTNTFSADVSMQNVGFGVATPEYRVHIYGSGSVLPRILFENADASSGSRWFFDVSDGGDFRISEDGSGTQELIISDTTGYVGMGTTGASPPVCKLDVRGDIKSTARTVATLPTGSAGMRSFVTDANSTTFASVVAGGGGNGVPVYHDGTNWRIG